MGDIAREKLDFSPDPQASLLGLTTPDGRLRVFDRLLNTLKTEFLPTSHLTAACTALAWRPSPQAGGQSAKKHRKRKNSLGPANGLDTPDPSRDDGPERFDHVGIGAADGSVLIFALNVGQVKHNQSQAHTGQVHDMTWSRNGNELFSCGQDGTIGRLNARKSTFSQFPVESQKSPLFAIRLHPSEKSAVVGGRAKIFWVQLANHSILKTFIGHQGEVRALQVFQASASLPPLACSSGSSEKDHIVSIWSLNSEGAQDSLPEATLNANESVQSLWVSVPHPDLVSDVRIGCVTTSGVFRCFEFDPESKRKKHKSLKPKISVQVATEKDQTTGKVTPLPVLAAALSGDHVHLVHGSSSRPAFEELEYSKLDKITCLVRSLNTEPVKAQAGTKIAVPDSTSKNVIVVGPTASLKNRKRKTSINDKIQDLPMIERLRLLSKETDHVTTPPRTDSVLQLLLQGLHNQDQKILNSVLDRADSEMIDKTVQKLPVEGVIPLVQELHHFIQGRGMVNNTHSKWLRSVLQHHTAFLMSNPHCQELLGPVHAMLEARTRHYAPLAQLKGKLDILTKQISMKPQESQAFDVAKEALLTYRDDSSDEQSDIMDELLPPASDMEDNWKFNNDQDEVEEDDDESEDEEEMGNGEGGDDSDEDDNDDDEMESD